MYELGKKFQNWNNALRDPKNSNFEELTNQLEQQIRGVEGDISGVMEAIGFVFYN
jgi:hypothetical protein